MAAADDANDNGQRLMQTFSAPPATVSHTTSTGTTAVPASSTINNSSHTTSTLPPPADGSNNNLHNSRRPRRTPLKTATLTDDEVVMADGGGNSDAESFTTADGDRRNPGGDAGHASQQQQQQRRLLISKSAAITSPNPVTVGGGEYVAMAPLNSKHMRLPSNATTATTAAADNDYDDDNASNSKLHLVQIVSDDLLGAVTWCGCVPLNRNLAVEALPSLLFSVVGLMLAGILLDHIQHWRVFENISELIILVPVLLNLKGNLEMNLAARVSTAANLGHLDEPESRRQILVGNLMLMQIQGIIVGTVAGLASVFFGILLHGTINTFGQTTLMLACSIVTASVASLALGSLMCGIVVLSRKYRVNPDNIATPLAASLGDLVTLLALSWFASLLDYMGEAASMFVIFLFFALLPILLRRVLDNPSVKRTVKQGWAPLLVSMVIASFSGMVLEQYIDAFDGMALLAPVINGIAGNLGAIFSSRIATSLHGELHENHARTMATLFLINVPIQMFFLILVTTFHLGHVTITWGFAFTYLICTMVLLVSVLALAKYISQWMWKWGYDPHNYVLPYLTSLGDVFGTVLVVLAFNVHNPVS